MKTGKTVLFLALAVAVLATGVAYAENVQGHVISVDLAAKTIKISKAPEQPDAPPEVVTVWVNDTTTYSGEATVLAEVIEGDNVSLDVVKDEASGNWIAKSVNVTSFNEE